MLLLLSTAKFDCIHVFWRKAKTWLAVFPVIKAKHQLEPNAMFDCGNLPKIKCFGVDCATLFLVQCLETDLLRISKNLNTDTWVVGCIRKVVVGNDFLLVSEELLSYWVDCPCSPIFLKCLPFQGLALISADNGHDLIPKQAQSNICAVDVITLSLGL